MKQLHEKYIYTKNATNTHTPTKYFHTHRGDFIGGWRTVHCSCFLVFFSFPLDFVWILKSHWLLRHSLARFIYHSGPEWPTRVIYCLLTVVSLYTLLIKEPDIKHNADTIQRPMACIRKVPEAKYVDPPNLLPLTFITFIHSAASGVGIASDSLHTVTQLNAFRGSILGFKGFSLTIRYTWPKIFLHVFISCASIIWSHLT